MATWSGLRTKVEKLFAPAVRGRTKLKVVRYRRAHDAEGRWALELDGIETGGIGDIPAHLAERTEIERLQRDRDESPGAVQPEARRRLRAEGKHSLEEFYASLESYIGLSIQDARASEDVLIRALAILDRRFGKRRLTELASSPPKQPLELACLRFRLEAESLHHASRSK